MAVKRYDGSAWQTVAGLGAQGAAATSSSIATWVKTASGGETSLSGNDDNSQALSYTVGQELVFINGTLLKRGSDYTATNGTTITGLTALAANDVATVWTVNAFSVTNAISNTLVDAKGDLVTASSADVPARLAVGSNGETLVADSSATTGLRYTPTGLSNPIINGGMDVWQRGTSFTVSNGTYLMDRWYNTGNASLTVTRDTDVPTTPYFNYSAKLVGTGTQSISQRIESAESTKLTGQVVTISLYAKKTSGTGALDINIYYPSATDNFASVTQIGSALQMSANPGSSWARYSVTTSALPADVQKGLLVLINNTNTHTIFVTGVQIDVGSVALPFRRAGGTIQGELAACQRYFQRLINGADSSVENLGVFQVLGSTTGIGSVKFFMPMRVTPTISISAAGHFQRFDSTGGTLQALSAFTFQQGTPRTTRADATWTSGTTAGHATFVIGNSASATLDASAEL
jgi:hypothetical protein